jgi:hypothetical protein
MSWAVERTRALDLLLREIFPVLYRDRVAVSNNRGLDRVRVSALSMITIASTNPSRMTKLGSVPPMYLFSASRESLMAGNSTRRTKYGISENYIVS